MRVKLPTKGELAALAVRDWCKADGLPTPTFEVIVCEGRRFRFDVAWVDELVALEFQGGQWVRGRHNRPSGFSSDCEKMSLAAIAGFRVLLATYEQFNSGQLREWLRAVFKINEGKS